MTADSTERDAWLKTVAADVGARGFERASETIVPQRELAEESLSRIATLAPSGASTTPPLEFSRTLAQGGMGIIRLATQVALGREVAVKALRADRADREAAHELLREAWITGCLEHPNIVPVHDIVLDENNHPLVVLKHIVGQSWSELFADEDAAKRFGAGDLMTWNLEVLLQVINAIRYAHSRGIVHRDLKPDNVMIGPFGEVYVVDWGLAVSVEEDAGGGRFPRAVDEAEKIAGTPAYMAPEMLGREGAVLDERTDIYLLGAILCEIVTGRPPHRGKKLLAVLEHVRSGEVSFPATVPAELVGICRRALSRDPDGRQQSADELRRELQTFLAHLGSSRLAAAAEASLAEMIAELDHEELDRKRLYNLFGECRFGFRAALAAWDDNPVARRGLADALTRVIGHELDRGDDGAAQALLAEHADPPAELQARAVRIADERREREARLRAIDTDRDPLIGGRTRLVLTLFAALTWTALPIALALLDFESRVSAARFYEGAIVLMFGWIGMFLASGYLSRESLGKTRFNRLLYWNTLFGAVATLTLFVSLRVLDAPATSGPIFAMLVWAAVGGPTALILDRRMIMVVVAWLVASAVAALEPGSRYWLMAASNLFAVIAALVVWGPGVRAAYYDRDE